MKFIGYMKGLSEGYAARSEDSTFEVVHVRDVAYYSEKLAFERGLDENVALAIAYGHDLGRTKLGVSGKNHARVSAKFMKALMTASDFDAQTQSTIAYAIKKHNIKAKCHDDYAELIKDADSLAHQDEGLFTDNHSVEAYRAIISKMKELSIVVAPLDMWCEQYDLHRTTFLQHLLQLETFKDDSRHWVHEQRKNVRKLRSMIWYLKVGASDDRFDTLDGLLKRFFGDLSEARMCHVQIDLLKKMPNQQSVSADESKLQQLEERLAQELDKIESRLSNGSYEALIQIFNQTFDLNAGYFEDPLINQSRWLSSFNTYLLKANRVEPKNLKALHQLRIHGKNFKYMSELELIQFSSQAVETVIEHLHDHIGALNDFGDIKNMKQWKSLYEADRIEAEIISVQKLCKKELFFFTKLEQMIKTGQLPIVSKL